MKCIVVHPNSILAYCDPTPSIETPGDRVRAPNAPLPRASYAPDIDDPLVAALGDQLLAAWLGENAPKLRLPLLTSCSEPGNTPAPNGGTSETWM